jgi:hypothetical protein
MDERKLCRLNPVVPNSHIHIYDPSKEWCGQAKLKIDATKIETTKEDIEKFYQQAKQSEDQPMQETVEEIAPAENVESLKLQAKRGRPKK